MSSDGLDLQDVQAGPHSDPNAGRTSQTLCMALQVGHEAGTAACEAGRGSL